MIWLLAMIGQTSVCSADALEAPVPIAFHDGRFGSPRAPCPSTELSLAGGANVIADREHFYGNLRAFGLLEASHRLRRELELFAEIELVRYQTVLSSLSAEAIGFGHSSFGATWMMIESAVLVSGSLRLTLPTASGYYVGARSIALDGSIVMSTLVIPTLEVHAALGMLGSAGIGTSPLLPRGGLSFLAGAAWRPISWFALIADVSLAMFYAANLDSLGLGGGARFLVGSVGIDLFAAAPLVGNDRTTVAGLFRVRYDFR